MLYGSINGKYNIPLVIPRYLNYKGDGEYYYQLLVLVKSKVHPATREKSFVILSRPICCLPKSKHEIGLSSLFPFPNVNVMLESGGPNGETMFQVF